MKYISTVNGSEYLIEIVDERHIIVNDKKLTVDFNSVSGQPVYSLLVDGKSIEGFVYPGETEWEVLLMGRQYPVEPRYIPRDIYPEPMAKAGDRTGETPGPPLTTA